jgi:hypothetical protein
VVCTLSGEFTRSVYGSGGLRVAGAPGPSLSGGRAWWCQAHQRPAQLDGAAGVRESSRGDLARCDPLEEDPGSPRAAPQPQVGEERLLVGVDHLGREFIGRTASHTVLAALVACTRVKHVSSLPWRAGLWEMACSASASETSAFQSRSSPWTSAQQLKQEDASTDPKVEALASRSGRAPVAVERGMEFLLGPAHEGLQAALPPERCSSGLHLPIADQPPGSVLDRAEQMVYPSPQGICLPPGTQGCASLTGLQDVVHLVSPFWCCLCSVTELRSGQAVSAVCAACLPTNQRTFHAYLPRSEGAGRSSSACGALRANRSRRCLRGLSAA